ncbi:hypothetical protein HMPREF9080_01743 [Cardiobacterium valvarum F0432]|uniref:Uncharacterized protein n=1 Tax=Cardiobacterium valvarum F0432 TaxID=797473 RepID=G9ZG70_9GAMM|nr:hypothetical protein HMPREF9080_01743 [Cardiobacterium valvarum F0432]
MMTTGCNPTTRLRPGFFCLVIVCRICQHGNPGTPPGGAA